MKWFLCRMNKHKFAVIDVKHVGKKNILSEIASEVTALLKRCERCPSVRVDDIPGVWPKSHWIEETKGNCDG